jgi:NAD-dependent dihydropyrimidine dehydrogenase PreA subunit
MTHVITDACLKDGLCLDQCPTGAIRPDRDDANFAEVGQLYINPEDCMDCGACLDACPAGAIFAARRLPKGKADAALVNYRYFLPPED